MSSEQAATPAHGRFLTASETIGDLGNPFYDDERQREVWNEASAVGFQAMLWLALAAAAAMVWIGGAPSLPYAITLFGIAGVGSVVVLAYARAHQVDAWVTTRVNRGRTALLAALVAVLVAGVVRALPDHGFGGGLGIGVACGALLAAVGGLAGAWSTRRRTRQQDQELGES
ncbi:MAG: DUF2029 domain-containing protein [Mycobacteriaceae bacterium]